jgi:hypothetical protein
MKLEQACARMGLGMKFLCLASQWLYPFIHSRARLIMHGSQMFTLYTFEQLPFVRLTNSLL